MLFSYSLKKDSSVEKKLVPSFNLYVNIVRYNGVNQKACSMKSHFPIVLFSKSSSVRGWSEWFCILFPFFQECDVRLRSWLRLPCARSIKRSHSKIFFKKFRPVDLVTYNRLEGVLKYNWSLRATGSNSM